YRTEGMSAYLHTQVAINHRDAAGGIDVKKGKGGFGTTRGKRVRTFSKGRIRSGGMASTKKAAKIAKTPKNSWNAFLQKNKGKYKGNGWVKKAAADYRAQQAKKR
ncbi:MAG: hypothetical protein AAFS12_05155, partial [Cyanobacteria bacterium J06632_19]